MTAENGVGQQETAETVNETLSDRQCLKRDFQSCLQNFSSLNTVKVTDLASLTVWDRQKTACDGQKRPKTDDETRPDWLHLR